MSDWDPYGGYRRENDTDGEDAYPQTGDGEDAYGTTDPYGGYEGYDDVRDGKRPGFVDPPEYGRSFEEAPPPPRQNPTVISTNATINLTCTLCAGCGLFGLFLYFVDRRSRAVRRCAVQSAGLLCVTVFLSAGLAVLATLFGMIPLIGGLLGALSWMLMAAVLCGDIYLRVRLMAHAYRGEAYVLPLIGRQCRQFE